MALSETWIKKQLPRFAGYRVEWKNRVSTSGGGLGFLVKRGIQYQNIELLPYAGGVLEFQCVKMFMEDSVIQILHIYNPNKNVSVGEMTHYISQQIWEIRRQIYDHRRYECAYSSPR